MAMVEVKDDGPQGIGGEFFQFNAIGDKLDAYFVDSFPSMSKFAAEKPGSIGYRFFDRTKTMRIVDPPHTKLAIALERLAKDGKLVKGVNVAMVVKGELDTGQKSKMKVYAVSIDLDDNQKPIVHANVLDAINKYVPPAKPEQKEDDPFGASAGDDDIPF